MLPVAFFFLPERHDSGVGLLISSLSKKANKAYLMSKLKKIKKKSCACAYTLGFPSISCYPVTEEEEGMCT